MVAIPMRKPPDSAELIVWAAEALAGVDSRSTSWSEARKVAAKVKVCSTCNGATIQSGGEKARTLHRTRAARPPSMSRLRGPTRRRQGSMNHMKPTSTATPSPHSRPVMLSGNPCCFQVRAENE